MNHVWTLPSLRVLNTLSSIIITSCLTTHLRNHQLACRPSIQQWQSLRNRLYPTQCHSFSISSRHYAGKKKKVFTSVPLNPKHNAAAAAPPPKRKQPSPLPASPQTKSSSLQHQPKANSISKTLAAAQPTPVVAAPANDATSQPVLTWRDYDPEGGMPLPEGDLPPGEIHRVLGSTVDVDTGNFILNVMNWRRQSGALIDKGLDFAGWESITRDQALAALDYIRELDPNFDEQAAGQLWVEEETERARLEMQERSIRLGIYRAEPEAVQEEVEEEPQQGTEYGRRRTGESALIQERQRREAEWEAEKAREAINVQQKEVAAIHASRGPLELGGGVQPAGALVKHDPAVVELEQRRERAKAWREKWEKKATISTSQEIPQMSVAARLGPAFLVLLASTGAAWLFYQVYTPPPTSARIWPDIPPAIATVSAVTAALVASAVACRFPPFWPFVSKFFTIVPAYPYALSILGSAFRHDRLQHLASNLVVLWLVGPTLHEDVGRGGFLAILIASAACGGFASLTYEVLTKSWTSYIFGASNAVLGVFAAACTIRPNRSIHVFGYDVPFAAWIFLALNLTGETVGLMAGYGAKLSIDFAGHIGGQLAGLGSALYLRSLIGEGGQAVTHDTKVVTR